MSRDEVGFQFPDDIDQINQASHAVWRVPLGIGKLGARCSSYMEHSRIITSREATVTMAKDNGSRKAVKNRLSRAHRWAAQRCLMSESPFARVASREGH